jgi:hypothetical protein
VAKDLDLIQALYQTKRSLDAQDQPEEHVRSLDDKVTGLLSRYQLSDDAGEVAYREQGADMVDLEVPGSVERKGQVQAALIAYADLPTPEQAALAEAAIDDLSDEIDGS